MWLWRPASDGKKINFFYSYSSRKATRFMSMPISERTLSAHCIEKPLISFSKATVSFTSKLRGKRFAMLADGHLTEGRIIDGNDVRHGIKSREVSSLFFATKQMPVQLLWFRNSSTCKYENREKFKERSALARPS